MKPVTGNSAFQAASPLKRLAAAIIDSLILSAIGAAVMIAGSIYLPVIYEKFSDYLPMVFAFLVLLYYARGESSHRSTFGKSIMGLSVTDLEGQPLSFWRAIVRFIGKLISGVPIGAGYVMVFFNDSKRALHDLLAQSMVIDVKLAYAASANSPAVELEGDDAPPPPDPSLLAFGHTQGSFAHEPAPKAKEDGLDAFGAPLAGSSAFDNAQPSPAGTTPPPPTKPERVIPKGMFPCPSCGTAAGQYQTKCFKCGTKLNVAMFKQYMAGK